LHYCSARKIWVPAQSGRLAFLATETSRIKRGTGIMRLAARAPANAAMSAAA
jgi:alkanesulfonate monooxygenase SsuD/methylene tetrahydromethanopterin reductase-like flavin-dependent oxidoreductase (luciferase family)